MFLSMSITSQKNWFLKLKSSFKRTEWTWIITVKQDINNLWPKSRMETITWRQLHNLYSSLNTIRMINEGQWYKDRHGKNKSTHNSCHKIFKGRDHSVHLHTDWGIRVLQRLSCEMDPAGSGLLLWDALVNSWFYKRLRISNQVATSFSQTLPPELLILPSIENYGTKKYFTNFFVPWLLENLVSLEYLKSFHFF